MKKVLPSLMITMSFLAPALSYAGDRVDQRQEKQQARIRQGVKSGELTKKEAKRLRKGQRKVRRMERRAEKDGVVTQREAGRLERAQNKQSKRIYKQKHDKQDRR